MNWRINRYNKKSAKKYGWHPSWFDRHLTDFDTELIECIKWFQLIHDLEVDGMVGPMTFRRALSTRDLETSKNYILVDGQHIDIDWDVKIDLMPKNCFKTWRKEREPNMIVTHWDATTSAEKCKRVLQARGISTHFCIDNDGVIHQYVDVNNVAWHARGVNNCSIGIDFTNAYYLKYKNYYINKGFNERPVCKDSVVHNVKLRPHLGYYPVQISAYKKLVETLCSHYDIPFCVPTDDEGNLSDTVDKSAAKGKFNGVVCHYHLTRGKIDCAGLKLKEIIQSLC